MEIRDFFTSDLHLSDSALVERLAENAQLAHLKKGELLVEAGERQSCLPFLLSGILRGFFLDKDGRDFTDCFACCRGEAAMGCNQLDQPSQINIEAVTQAELLTLPMDTVMAELERHLELQRVYNHYLVEALRRHWEEKQMIARYSADERYQWLLRTHPGLIGCVSGKHIASFLGMTPVSLSRVRRRLREISVGGRK